MFVCRVCIFSVSFSKIHKYNICFLFYSRVSVRNYSTVCNPNWATATGSLFELIICQSLKDGGTVPITELRAQQLHK